MIEIKNKKIVYLAASALVMIGISIASICVLNVTKSKDEKNDQVATISCPSGFIVVPGNKKYETNDFCVMKYEAKDVNGNATSQANKEPWVDINQNMATILANNSCKGCHLITENEWMTIAQNILSVSDNWKSNKVGVGSISIGHSNSKPAKALGASSSDDDSYFGLDSSDDFSQRRTLKLTNGQIIWDFSGNVAEWTSGMTTGGQPGMKSDSTYSWKEWNLIDQNGFLPVKPMPSYGNDNAGIWSSNQGIGRLYSNSNDVNPTSFIRGGSYDSGTNSGVMSLNMSNHMEYHDLTTGFRVSK